MTREERIAAIRKNEVTISLPMRGNDAIWHEMEEWCVANIGPKGDHPIVSVWENRPTTLRAWSSRMITPDMTDTTYYFAFWFARTEDVVFFALRWKGET